MKIRSYKVAAVKSRETVRHPEGWNRPINLTRLCLELRALFKVRFASAQAAGKAAYAIGHESPMEWKQEARVKVTGASSLQPVDSRPPRILSSGS
jgi:hypothetical protein